jgi:uncharacterized protein (TIGR02145 family)
MILKKSMPFLFIPLFISLVACLGDQNDITNESQVNLLDDFNYTAYWENNEQVQERCVKSDSLCIEEHWVNIGEPAGLSYLPVEEISSSSHSSSSALILSSSVISNNSEAASSSAEVSSSSEEISSSSELSSSSSIEEISSSNVVIQTVARPTFSIEGGIYTSTQSVAISTTTAEATIYYTKNGSMPTTSSLVYNSSIVYNGPISVSTSQTLRAIAVKTAWDNSAVFTASYVINPSSGTFTDNRDSKTYKTTTIGTQVWMAENLNYETTSGSHCYDDNSTNCDTYGRLYTWSAAMNGASSSSMSPSGVQGVCPTGWHLPSDAEWTELTDYIIANTPAAIESRYDIGGYLKHTYSSSFRGNDYFGFSALSGGYHDGSSFERYGTNGFWWSSTEYESTPIERSLNYRNDIFGRSKSYAYSVRCLRDSPQG